MFESLGRLVTLDESFFACHVTIDLFVTPTDKYIVSFFDFATGFFFMYIAELLQLVAKCNLVLFS